MVFSTYSFESISTWIRNHHMLDFLCKIRHVNICLLPHFCDGRRSWSITLFCLWAERLTAEYLHITQPSHNPFTGKHQSLGRNDYSLPGIKVPCRSRLLMWPADIMKNAKDQSIDTFGMFINEIKNVKIKNVHICWHQWLSAGLGNSSTLVAELPQSWTLPLAYSNIFLFEKNFYWIFNKIYF